MKSSTDLFTYLLTYLLITYCFLMMKERLFVNIVYVSMHYAVALFLLISLVSSSAIIM